MVRTLAPRVVLVTRRSDYDNLLAQHGTRQQARFFLESRDQTIDDAENRHHSFEEQLTSVLSALPVDWRRTRVDRGNLDRFLFEDGDLVVALGQDGLVANLAKYLRGQLVIGLDPDPDRNAGVLVRHAPADAGELVRLAQSGAAQVEERTMVEAQSFAGSRVLALNEVFLGHRSHQSARYFLRLGSREERQSSSGLIVSTGTGATGWASSISRERASHARLPAPPERASAFFVREAWPGAGNGVSLTEGWLEDGDELLFTSRMEDGVVFGDGIEADSVPLTWGQTVVVRLAPERLRLVAG